MPIRSIDFIYDASGTKWRKVVKEVGQPDKERDYIQGAEYQNGVQDIIHFSEGYVQRDATTDGDANWKGWVYKFTLKDHLGNTRVTYSDRDNNGIVGVSDIEQMNHYYASGLNMEGSWNGANGAFKFGYNGKEWNDDFGLGWNDYGARFYDPAIYRWLSVDPLAESYFRWSPYHYAYDNPIRNIDPDGMRVSLADDLRQGIGIDVESEKEAEEARANKEDAPDNEYEVVIQNGEVHIEMTGTKGGDETDYIKVIDTDKGNGPRVDAISNLKVDVEIDYTSGPGNIHKQKDEPTPGHRTTHGKTYTEIEAYLWLTGAGETKEVSTIVYAAKKGGKKILRDFARESWDDIAGSERMGRQKGNAPRSNQAQNKQFDSLVKQYGLSKDQSRKLHDAITGQGLGYKQIEALIIEMFK